MGMEDSGTSEEDYIESQDSNIRTDHGHLARNCSIKTITPAVKALVIYTATVDAGVTFMGAKQFRLYTSHVGHYIL